MGRKDRRVDLYIAKSAEFARPVLAYLRKVVHAACPDVEETMKWSVPHFDYRGEMMCSMAAFKAHCAFGFWKGELVVGRRSGTKEAAGHLGRITTVDDLPSDAVLTRYIKKAMKLNEEGVKAPARDRAKAPRPVEVPSDLRTALRKNKEALAVFEGFSPSHKREYIAWITEAKTEETRQRRLASAVEWIAEGKPRHWKYTKN
jgi:uncharacterized protein YdeI (YjbR/CyaY-like superfamily)